MTAAYAVVVLVVAIVAIVVGIPSVHHAITPPSPAAPQAVTPVTPSASSSSTVEHAHRPSFRCPAVHSTGGGDTPEHICIPALRVATSVLLLGLNADHTVQVPALSQVREVGWYKYSAAPGHVGPTVILGHVDSAEYGDGVFFHLSSLHAGDTVALDRADGKVATFVVDRVTEVPKTDFPTQAVYGPTSGPALRLITCGGPFDASTRNYLDNIIVWGSLRSVS